MREYPNISLEVVVDNQQVDIISEGFDAGIRYGDIIPKDMIAAPLSEKLKWIVVAAPDYVEKYGVPLSPDDLKEHQCINMRLGNGTLYHWELGNNENSCRVLSPGKYI